MTMRLAALLHWAARAKDEPISPTPMIANSSNIGSASCGLRRSITSGLHELGQRGHNAAVGLFVPDSQTQTIRQPVG